ncbi:hypothetical protein WH47_01012 [Habropoda laboriosa]|uniref:Uncharacterized protein n=1 Tax=Habropoda laboriosa TaxID=597456 RepID=A0A0L7R5N0_9HYME|nr:hypothetical protein WH47_01012 [Habropoda laboriosa]
MVANNMPYPCPGFMARQMSAFSRLLSTMYFPPTDIPNFDVNKGNHFLAVDPILRAK